jgi:hypothetical protein
MLEFRDIGCRISMFIKVKALIIEGISLQTVEHDRGAKIQLFVHARKYRPK